MNKLWATTNYISSEVHTDLKNCEFDCVTDCVADCVTDGLS